MNLPLPEMLNFIVTGIGIFRYIYISEYSVTVTENYEIFNWMFQNLS